MKENNQGCPEYLFVAFSSKQFSTASDAERLHELARHATEEAGLQCYWLSLNCMADETDSPTVQALDVSLNHIPTPVAFSLNLLGLENQ